MYLSPSLYTKPVANVQGRATADVPGSEQRVCHVSDKGGSYDYESASGYNFDTMPQADTGGAKRSG